MTVEKFTPLIKTTHKEENSWHILEIDDLLRGLATYADKGLSSEEVARRLLEYGPNQLEEAAPLTFWRMLWEQFNNFIVIMLIVAALISAFLGEFVDAMAILAIVILNAILGVTQERKAEEALAALRKLSAPEAHVIRDGIRQVIPSHQLVPGDLVMLEAGNYVPADVRLLEAVNLQIDEAALTGESMPVQKDASATLEKDIPLGDRKNTAFMGTLVTYGRGRAVVVSTGMHTQIGLIAEMLQAVEQEPTPLQRRLDQLGKMLGWAALLICAVIFAVGWARGHNPLDMFLIAVGLAIAAVPEGLPAVVTISLALGMREMIKRHALIRRLSSVETLGSATVICSDKTGTLTQNEMTVTRLWVDGKNFSVSGGGYTPQGEFFLDQKPVDLKEFPGALTALWVAALNNDAELNHTGLDDGKHSFRIIGDPTEGALIVAAVKAGASLEELNASYPRVQEIPFDATRKRMVTIHSLQDSCPEDMSPFFKTEPQEWYAVLVKGAPDLVLDLCSSYQRIDDHILPLDENERMKILAANDSMTQNALRVLGMAYRVLKDEPDLEDIDSLESDLTFAGLIGMIDPPRPEVPPALAKAESAGIRTVMITGDYPMTARAIAESIGLLAPGHQVLSGPEMSEIDDETLQRQVMYTDVFARVSPTDKMRIVEALQANDQVVAMTGDGVNDAPAIKRSDIGVAMGITGTDVAKESADMVLTDDNYASIVSAVEQGRIIYDNIQKFVFFLLSSNIAEIMVIFLATIAGLPTPLTVIQLLWLNLLTDGAPALALAMEKGASDTMRRKPRPKNEPIIDRGMRLGIVIQTITQTGATLTAFVLGLLLSLQQQGVTLPAGTNPLAYLLSFNWQGVDVQSAETMAFVTLSLCELFRAYTVRSDRLSVFQLGIFSNRYMQYAVGLSIFLLLLVVTVPFLQTIFNTHFMQPQEWAVVLGLSLVPAISEELTKAYLRWRDRRS